MSEARALGAGVASQAALLLTADEAARILAVSRATVYNLLDAGEITSIHIGRARRIPFLALQEFVDRLVREQAETPAVGGAGHDEGRPRHVAWGRGA